MRSNVRTTETRPVFLRRKCVQLLGSLAREWREHELQDTTVCYIFQSRLYSLGRGRRKYRVSFETKSPMHLADAYYTRRSDQSMRFEG